MLSTKSHAYARRACSVKGSMHSTFKHLIRRHTACASQIPENMATAMKKLEGITFDNLTLRTLPVDESKNPNTRQVPGACFSLVRAGLLLHSYSLTNDPPTLWPAASVLCEQMQSTSAHTPAPCKPAYNKAHKLTPQEPQQVQQVLQRCSAAACRACMGFKCYEACNQTLKTHSPAPWVHISCMQVTPGKLENPKLVVAAPEALALLDIDPTEVNTALGSSLMNGMALNERI